MRSANKKHISMGSTTRQNAGPIRAYVYKIAKISKVVS